jgi:GR25 family glycosyltransferase involved in LPS biosynthesis
LIHHLETVYINNIGIPILENAYGDKFNISNYSENPALYEIPTINKILDFSKTVDCNILYLHTKGISYNDDDQKENDWIDMMLYFLVEKFELCLEKLQQGIQTVGCNYYDEKIKIRNPKHFSGNFWWADSQYISTLPALIEKTENVNPNDAEFWLCKNNPSVYEMHNSKINHYFDVYPSQNYQSHHIIINKLTHDYSSAWLGHMKFANWLVTLLNPKITVDLGVDYGHSTFSFASANKGIVYGIDSFDGDIQAGFKNTFDIVKTLNDDFNKKNYLNNNIKFIKGYFDNVYDYFNETIDILHIDGLHTIEAVSNDYNKWITKTSENAVILFHDVISYPDSVGKVFNDIKYPKFHFTHSAGLGVVCKNIETLDKIYSAINLPNKECIVYNNQIKIFVIHYKKLTDRKKSILTQFKKYNLTNYEFIEIDRDELDNYDTSLFNKNFGNALTAISLSHFYAYKKIAEYYDSALIFEDDVILSDNFMSDLIKYINELPNDFDILCIGDGCNVHVNNVDLQPNKHIYKRQIKQDNHLMRCADSYIVSKKCAEFLCEYINNSVKNINKAIDCWLNDIAVENNFIVYWAEPTIVTQGSQNGLFDRSWYEQKQLCNSFIDFDKISITQIIIY